jgi:predicted nuclease of predicted toxin-antitoxin system
MRFFVDNAISPVVSEKLNELNHNSVHVRQYNMQDASDDLIFKRAFEEDRIIITADTDFGFLLSKWGKSHPSVIIFRKGIERNPLMQIQIFEKVLKLEEVIESLNKGSIIILEKEKVRIRSLPI